MRVFAALIAFLILAWVCFGVGLEPRIVWEKTYVRRYGDFARSIVPSGDGGFVVVGETFSPESRGDLYVLKVDADGEKVWERTFGGDGWDEARCVVGTGDGGFLVAGLTESFHVICKDVYVIRIDAEGNKLWERTYGNWSHDWASCVVQSGDGGFVMVGETRSSWEHDIRDAYLIKINDDGDIVWERSYGGSGFDTAYSIAPSDGGFLVVGYTGEARSGRAFILEIDDDGNQIWSKTYPGMLSSIFESGEGEYVVGGRAHPGHIFLCKIDSEGGMIWNRTYQIHLDSYWPGSVGIAKDLDGGYVIAGRGAEVYLLKVDSEGNRLWEMTRQHPCVGLGTRRRGEYHASRIVGSSDGGFVVAGYARSFELGEGDDVYLLKVKVVSPKPSSWLWVLVLPAVVLAFVAICAIGLMFWARGRSA